MKKALLLIGIIGLCCCACSKYCTCSTNTDGAKAPDTQEFEVPYNDNCSDYSTANMSCR